MTAIHHETLKGLAGVELENALAGIEKGQQLAGHFPDGEDMDRARRILTGELSAEDARNELAAMYGYTRRQ